MPSIPEVADPFTRPACRACTVAAPIAVPSLARVTRPAKFLGTHYNEASKVIYQGINQILNGTPAKSILPGVQSKLNQILKQK